MSNDASPPNSSHEEKLQEVLLHHLQAMDAGLVPSRDELLHAHPELADDLRAYFADQDKLEQVAEPLRASGPAEAVTLGDSRMPAGVLARIKYFGDYELLEEIAHGGMGVVYKARQVTLQRIVALKMIRAGQFASQVEVDRFHREAEAAANLDHPNIIPIYEVGEHQGEHYFSMKLVEGGSLAQWIADCRLKIADFKKEQSAMAGLMARMARAVHYAHQRGILHRDLKPANVLLDCPDKSEISNLRSAIPLITDFGLAKRLEIEKGITQSGAIVGTPSYMAPEQASSRVALTTAADVYSLGAILYELLTGQPPFQAETPLDIYMQVLEREPTPPRSVKPGVNRDLEIICLKCLEKDPARRYPSAEALADDLDRWLSGAPIVARPSTAWERTVKWVRRRPAVAALIGVSAAAAIALLVVGLIFDVRLYREEQRRLTQQVVLDNTTEAAKAANREAERDRLAAKETNALAARRLGQSIVANGVHYLEGGDLNNALTLFAEALKEDHDDPVRQNWHRIRINTTLRRFPRLAGLWEFDDFPMLAALSPDGHRAVVAGKSADGKAGWWQALDLATGKPLLPPVRLDYPVRWVAISPDGKTVVVAGGRSQPTKVGEAGGWDLATGKARGWMLKHDDEVISAVYRPDGRRIVTAGADGKARQWDAASGKLILPDLSSPPSVNYAEYSPDGARVITACGDGTARLWDAATGKALHEPLKHEAPVYFAIFNQDSSRVATASTDKSARIWDVATGKQVGKPLRHDDEVWHIAYSPDARYVATASKDRTARVWDADSGTLVCTLKHEAPVHRVVFSPDGRLVATGGDDGTTRVWEAATAEPATPPLKQGSFAFAVFGSDGNSLLTGGTDQTVRLWDLAPGEGATPPIVHLDKINNVQCSPDGRWIASASDDQTARLWDAATGQPSGPALRHDGPVSWVGFSLDSRRVATSANGQTRIWDITSGKMLEVVKSLKEEEWLTSYRIRDASLFYRGSKAWLTESMTQNWDKVNINLAPGQSLTSVLEGKIGHRLCPDYSYNTQIKKLTASMDGRRLFCLNDEAAVRIWDVGPDKRAVEDLVLLAQVLTGQRLDSVGSFTTITSAERRTAWEKLKTKYPPAFAPASAQQVLAWHRSEAVAARAGADRRAEVWHLAPLIAAEPKEAVWYVYRAAARIYPDAQDFEGAIADCTKAIELGVSGPAAWHNRGIAHRQLEDWEMALTDYNKAIQLKTKGPDVWTERGDIFAGLKHWKEALKDYDSAIELKAEGSYVWQQRGAAYAALEQWDKAIKDYSAAISLRPEGSYIWKKRGEAYLALKQWERALADYGKGIQTEPNDWNAWVQRGMAYANLQRWDRALDDFNKAIELDSGQSDVWDWRGYVRLQRQEWNQALADYTRAIELDDEDPRFYEGRGGAYFGLKKWTRAIADYDKAIELKMEGPSVWQGRGDAYAELRQWEKAIADFGQALARKAEGPYIWQRRAGMYAELGQWDRAASDLAKARQVKPDAWETWDIQGLHQLRTGNMAAYRENCAEMLRQFAAKADADVANGMAWSCSRVPNAVPDIQVAVRLADRALAKDPKDANILSTSGCALYRAGDFQKAINRLNQSIKEHGKGGTSLEWLFLAMAHQRAGHGEEARQWLSKAVSEIERDKESTWDRRLELKLLKQEAEQLLKK